MRDRGVAALVGPGQTQWPAPFVIRGQDPYIGTVRPSARPSVRPFPNFPSPRTLPAVTYNSFLSPDILVVRFSAIGDILLTTPLLRAIRTKWPGARVTVLTRRQYVSLVSDNPNVTEVFGIGPQQGVRSVAAQIKTVKYSHILDLQGATRTFPLRLLAPGPWSGFSHRRMARAFLIRFKHNSYQEHVPVAERYFEAAADLGVEPDGGPPDFFLNPLAEEKAAGWLARARSLTARGLRRTALAVDEQQARYAHHVALLL